MRPFVLIFTIFVSFLLPSMLCAQELDYIGIFNSPGRAYSARAAGDFLYIADFDQNLQIVDISDPENCREVSNYDTPGNTSFRLQLRDNIVFMAEGEVGLYLIDVSNPENPELLDSYNTPGVVQDVFVDGDFAYIADQGEGLRIVDISDPENIRNVGDCETIGNAMDIVVLDNMAYIADWEAGLTSVDVSDPEHPQIVGTQRIQGRAAGVAAIGNHVYVAGMDGGFFVFDVTEREEPRIVRTIDLPAIVSDVTLWQNLAFVANHEHGVKIFDISNRDDPEEIFSMNTPSAALDTYIGEDHVFVADWMSGVEIFDLTGLGLRVDQNRMDFDNTAVNGVSEQRLMLRNDSREEVEILNIEVEGDYFSVEFDDIEFLEPNAEMEVLVAFAPETHGEFQGLLTVFSDDPNHEEIEVALSGTGMSAIISAGPEEIDYGRVTVGIRAEEMIRIQNEGLNDLIISDVNIEGDYFYTDFENQITIEAGDSYNLTAWFEPEEDGNFNALLSIISNDQYDHVVEVSLSGMGFRGILFETADEAYNICISGNCAYAAIDRRGIEIIDVTEPFHPRELGQHNTPGQSYGVAVSGNIAFVADGRSGLCVIDVSDPDNTVEISRYNTDGEAWDVEVIEDYAFVADGEDGIRVIDIFDLERAVEVAGYDTPGFARAITIEGNLAYVADDVEGLLIFDLSDPEDLQLIGSFNTRGYTYDLSVSGNTVYLADERRGLIIIDISDLENPVEIAAVETENNTYSVDSYGQYVFCAEGEGGLKVLDVSDLENISVAETFNAPDVMRKVRINGYYAYTACGETGIIIYDLSDFIPHPFIALDQVAFDFGDVENGFSSEHTLVIGNAGETLLNVSGMSIEGDGFSIDFEDSYTLDPHQARRFILTFNPDQARQYDGVLSILSDSPGDERTLVELTGTGVLRQMTMPFSRGWNMISINVAPTEDFYLEGEDRGPDVVLMMEQLRIDADHHHIINLKDDNGMFYAPRFGFNNIPFWNLVKGYQVKVDAAVEAVWTGDGIPADTDIPLVQGWNTIAYFPTYELDASAPDYYVLSPIIDHVLYAKDVDARFIAPRYGFSDMDPWRQTQGYKVAVRENVVLNYPAEPGQEIAVADSREPSHRLSFKAENTASDQLGDNRTHWNAVQHTGQNMSILVLSAASDQFQAGDEIAAYNADGFQTGSGVVNEMGQCGFAVWGDDDLTPGKDGMQEGEAFELRCWSQTQEAEIPVEINQFLSGADLQYTPDELLVLELSVKPEAVTEFYLGEWYPNPFNADAFLRFGLPEAEAVNIGIYDLQGRLVERLLDEVFSAGHHTVRWNAAGVSAGVYLVRIQAGGAGQVSKVVLVK